MPLALGPQSTLVQAQKAKSTPGFLHGRQDPGLTPAEPRSVGERRQRRVPRQPALARLLRADGWREGKRDGGGQEGSCASREMASSKQQALGSVWADSSRTESLMPFMGKPRFSSCVPLNVCTGAVAGTRRARGGSGATAPNWQLSSPETGCRHPTLHACCSSPRRQGPAPSPAHQGLAQTLVCWGNPGANMPMARSLAPCRQSVLLTAPTHSSPSLCTSCSLQ